MQNAMNARFVGLRNFEETIRNPYFRLAVRNTLRFSAGGVTLVVIVAFALSLALHAAGRGTRSWLQSAFVLPMLLPSAAVACLVRRVFAASGGPLSGAFARLGMQEPSVALLSVYFLFVWKNTGFQLIVDLAALGSVPGDILEAAALDGANAVKRFWYITLPWVLPAVGFGAIYALAQSLRVYRETYLLYGEYPLDSVYFIQHYMNNHFHKLNYQRVASAALLVMLVLVAGALWGGALRRWRRRYAA